MSLKSVVRRVVVTGGLALTALLISHPDQAMMAKAKVSDLLDQATIYNSGSINRCAYSIQVSSDGSAFYTSCNANQGVGHVPWFLAQRFFADLNEAQPLALLPRGVCFNTGGYGTRTTVAYGAQSTPDLACDSFDPHVRSIYHDADEIWRFLNFNTDPQVSVETFSSAPKSNGHLAQLAFTTAADTVQPQSHHFLPFPPYGPRPPFYGGPFPPYGPGFPGWSRWYHPPIPGWYPPFYGGGIFPYTKTNGHLAQLAFTTSTDTVQPQSHRFGPFPTYGFYPPYGPGPFYGPFPPYGPGPFPGWPGWRGWGWVGGWHTPFHSGAISQDTKANGHLAQLAFTTPAHSVQPKDHHYGPYPPYWHWPHPPYPGWPGWPGRWYPGWPGGWHPPIPVDPVPVPGWPGGWHPGEPGEHGPGGWHPGEPGEHGPGGWHPGEPGEHGPGGWHPVETGAPGGSGGPVATPAVHM